MGARQFAELAVFYSIAMVETRLLAHPAPAMKLQKRGVVTLALTLALSGCTQSQTYSSVDQLKDAWVDAGGDCDESTDLESSLVSEGADAILCTPGIIMLIVFHTQE